MRTKSAVKITVDLLMTIALLFLSGYQLWGQAAHEWVGAGMAVLFIVHHILNYNWYKHLFTGKYTPLRIFSLVIDLLLLVVMVLLLYSGVAMSRHVFDFLPLEGSMDLARRLHILGSYWGFILISLHLGVHWNMILNMVRKKRKTISFNPIPLVLGFIVAIYGGVVFIKRDFLTYLFLRSEFVFLDYNEFPLFFYIDYLALMGLCIFIAYYGSRFCHLVHKGKEEDT